jgi:hypothetical protein
VIGRRTKVLLDKVAPVPGMTKAAVKSHSQHISAKARTKRQADLVKQTTRQIAQPTPTKAVRSPEVEPS